MFPGWPVRSRNNSLRLASSRKTFWKNPDLSYLKRNVPPEFVELTVRIAQSAIEHLPITTFSFGAPLFPGIEPVPLPGHTTGQAGYLLVDPNSEQQFLIGGDVCHNPTLHVSRPEWTTMGDSHPHLVRQTRLQLLSRIADKNIVFRCYHFAPGENGFIRPESGDRFRFVGRDPPTERGTESLADGCLLERVKADGLFVPGVTTRNEDFSTLKPCQGHPIKRKRTRIPLQPVLRDERDD